MFTLKEFIFISFESCEPTIFSVEMWFIRYCVIPLSIYSLLTIDKILDQISFYHFQPLGNNENSPQFPIDDIVIQLNINYCTRVAFTL